MQLIINDARVTAQDGMTILEVARESGIEIPTLCYLKDLLPAGACRICVVELEGSRTLVGACHTPAAAGMVIRTHSPKVLAARKVIIELMLASHPDNCLVCDKANLCELRRIAADLGIGLPRFRIRKHYYPVEDGNPYIIRDMSKCILCRRCINTCRDLNGKSIFSIAYRGFDSKVVYGLDQSIADAEACRDCVACISGCPTGALSKPARIGEEKRGTALILHG